MSAIDSNLCGAVHDWPVYFEKYTPEYIANARQNRTDEMLYIDTRWVVMYSNDEEKVSVERVQDCLRMLNLFYSGKNVEELAQVPDSQFCPWKSRVGVPNIQFLPLDASTLQVEYLKTSSLIDGSSPVDDAASRAGRVNGVLNIYIGNCGSGGILGQAELNSNIVFGMYATVGGYTEKGTLSRYDLGKTFAHEVGHALGLVHTFADSQCDGRKPYSDIPEQIHPNFNAFLVEISPGVWDQQNDNRYVDRQNGVSTHSCLSVDTSTNEMAINVMDYNDDYCSSIVSEDQVLIMREYLQSSSNTTLELKSADSVSRSAISSSSTGLIAPISPTTSNTGLSTGALVGIIVGVVAFIAIFGFLVYHYKTKKSSVVMGGSTKMMSAMGSSYLGPSMRRHY